MMIIKGKWFDGKTSAVQDVLFEITDSGGWQVSSADKAKSVIQQGTQFTMQISPRLGNTPRRITFAGDATFETNENDLIDQLIKEQSNSHWSIFVHLLESKLRYVLVAVLLMIGAGFIFVNYGVPFTSRILADKIPVSILDSTSEQTLKTLDKLFFTQSELAPEKAEELRRFLAPIIANHEELQLQLMFRKGNKIGANAFALPGGQIVFTDEMINLSSDNYEIMAIMAHEIGHVVHRHGLRRIIQNSLFSFALMAMTGDASGVSEIFLGLPVILTELGYSRKFEYEADQYAIDYLLKNNIDPGYLATILEKAENREKRTKKSEKSSSSLPSYLSTHPATEERIEIILQARKSIHM